MILTGVLKVLWWLVFASFKFIWTPMVLAAGTKYDWWESLLISILGGWIGVFAFYYFGKAIVNFFSRKGKKKKYFTRFNRFVVRVKMRYGIIGLSSIIAIISIPVCALIAAAYFRNDKRAIPVMMVSIVIWAVVLTAVFYFRKIGT